MIYKNKNTNTLSICFSVFFFFLVHLIISQNKPLIIKSFKTLKTGDQQIDMYIKKLQNKRVGILTNNTGVINGKNIVDTLLQLKVNVTKIFGPEHGFRGDADAAEKINNNVDLKTGLPIISLYGSNKKPTSQDLQNIDILIYDIQDVGVRFYTFISTMCYAMEACAENKIEFLILDRPNPNGFYIDGPILKSEFKSFLGLHAVPIVYGMTCGEYALMVNNEGWLSNKIKCNLSIVTLKNYDRKSSYSLPIKPSPNIPNEQAVLLYPSLGLFEGTVISMGRGTSFPFQVIGHPKITKTIFSFIPKTTPISKEPKYLNQNCFGIDLRKDSYTLLHPKKITLTWIINFYENLNLIDFFDANFNFHSGNNQLQNQLKNKMNEIEIRKTWLNDLENFKKIRKKYLLYADF